jgi:hypothetical protein
MFKGELYKEMGKKVCNVWWESRRKGVEHGKCFKLSCYNMRLRGLLCGKCCNYAVNCTWKTQIFPTFDSWVLIKCSRIAGLFETRIFTKHLMLYIFFPCECRWLRYLRKSYYRCACCQMITWCDLKFNDKLQYFSKWSLVTSFPLPEATVSIQTNSQTDIAVRISYLLCRYFETC